MFYERKKYLILTFILFLSMALSLVFPFTAKADDSTPPPVPTAPAADNPQPQTSSSEPSVNVAVPTDTAPADAVPSDEPPKEAAPTDVSSGSTDVATKESVATDVPAEPTRDVVTALADTGSVLVDRNNNPIPLSSQEAVVALSATDPWFDAGGGVVVGYSSSGVCAGAVTECHTSAAPIQAAINDVRSNGATIFVEQGSYNEDVTIAKQVTLTGLGSGATTNSFTLNSGANTTGSTNIFAPVVNVIAGAIVQNGVDLAASGGTVNVGPGTYTGQVVINGKNITLQGAAPGAVIQAPASVPICFTTSANHRPIVCVKNATNVIIKGLTVDGNGQGNANNRLDGIGYYNAGGTVQGNTIEHVRNDPLDGIQAGVGLYVYNQDGTPRTLNVFGNTIFDYQKNGMALSGNGLTAIVQNNTVTGAGATSLTAQNGIQLSYGAVGTISGNTISGNYWTGTYGGSNDPITDPNSDSAAGILLYQPGASTIQIFNNNVFGNQIGIASVDSADLNIHNNDIQGAPHQGHGYPTGIALWNSDGTIQNNTTTLNDYGVLVFDTPKGMLPVGIHNNSITENTLFGVWSNTLTDATSNWWGGASGPQDNSPVPDACGLLDTNPTGTGDGASPCVIYDPWLNTNPFAAPVSVGGTGGDGRDHPGSTVTSAVIPVTGGQPTTLSCGNLSITLQVGDIQVTFTGLCGYDVILNSVTKDALPGELGSGNKFEDGLTVSLLKDGKPVDTLPANASIQVSYPKPTSGDPSIMTWGDNGWNVLASFVENNNVVANLPSPATLVMVTH